MKPRQLQRKHSVVVAEGRSVQPPAEVPSALSPHRAFVVQFYAETELAQARCAGRVEHVVSGQATHFHSLEELLAFFIRVLMTVRTQPPPTA